MSWLDESMLVVLVWLVVAGLLDDESRPPEVFNWFCVVSELFKWLDEVALAEDGAVEG